MPYILIHGLGQGGDAWEPVRQCLRAKGWAAVCPELFSHLPEGADYDRLRRDFFSFCDAQAGTLHLCGLSLGGVLALDYAKAHPERMGSLVLIGTPCKLPRGLLRMQSLVFRCLPRAAFAEMGISRETACGLMTSVGERSIREGLERIRCRCLVLCGSKDLVNRKNAERLHRCLAGSRLQMIPGAGHEVNRDAPETLTACLADFWAGRP